MLSPEFERFCSEWLSKAEQYDKLTVDGCYDKFFTLFIVFNRLYAEATFKLIRKKCIKINQNQQLPDRKGATEYTLMTIGIDQFDQLYNSQIMNSVSLLCNLIDDERFYIKLSVPNGNGQREKDIKLLEDLRSTGEKRSLAILDLVYTVRCNLFHGHKAFQPAQVDLLAPIITILSAVISALHTSLRA